MLVPHRFDYEGLDPRAAFYLMRDLEAVISDKAFTSQKFAVGDHIYSVERTDNFEYIDPVDGTVARNQVSLVQKCTFMYKYELSRIGPKEMRPDIPLSKLSVSYTLQM